MNLSEDDLKKLCGFAVEAAITAGGMIAETRPQQVQRKEGGDSLASQVVTEVDEQSQSIILDILDPTLEEYDLALLTEETEDDGKRLEKDYFWCIDPIDGTLPFIEGVPGYAVSIALTARDGTPHIGVVYDPVEDTLYQAARDHGAFRNTIPWKIGDHGPQLQVFTDRSVPEEPWFIPITDKLGVKETHSQGGGVMNALWVLENPPACYFKFPRPEKGGGSLWDFAATACIAREVGGIASDIFGEPLDLNRTDSTFMNHCGILFATDADLARRIRALYSP